MERLIDLVDLEFGLIVKSSEDLFDMLSSSSLFSPWFSAMHIYTITFGIKNDKPCCNVMKATYFVTNIYFIVQNY